MARVSLAVGVALALAPAAHAATASIDYQVGAPRGEPVTAAAFLSYTAAPGETNDLTVSFDAGHWVFHDAGATISVNNCTKVDDHTADCAAGDGPIYDGGENLGLHGVTINLGDGDDTLIAQPLSRGIAADVRGGTGNDTLTGTGAIFNSSPRLSGGDGDDVLGSGAGDDTLEGGPGADTIDGGAGNDRLGGGAGTDKLIGGDGRDYLSAGGPAEGDTYDGGPGTDWVNYTGTGAALRIDIAQQTVSNGDTITARARTS